MTYRTGWIGERTLVDGCREILRTLSPRAMALISRVDSNPHTEAWLPALESLMTEPMMSVRDDGVLLSACHLTNLLGGPATFFCGFDEIWFFDEQGPRRPKPPNVVLTSDTRLTGGAKAKVLAWASDAASIAGFGDGVGLNYVIRAEQEDVLAKLRR